MPSQVRVMTLSFPCNTYLSKLISDAVASCLVPSLYTFTTLRLAASNLSKALYTVLTSSKVTSKSITLTLSHLA